MKKPLRIMLIALLNVTGVSDANGLEPSQTWQMNRLFHPTEADLAIEEKGRVMIFDGMTDKLVDRALDQHFHRIGAFMFTRTIVTDDTGSPLRDPDTGEFVIEEDGCD